jgi:DNA repair protein RecO (recombination protein O)
MNQDFQRTEGIILRVIPFRDYDQILTLFTPEAGIIKVIYKGSRSRRRGVQGLCLPLVKVEMVYRENRGEIFNCQEIGLLDSFSFLRKDLLYIEVACDLLHVIQSSQLAGKAAPQLYALLDFYLKKLPQTVDPWTIAVSFRLKLLRHEGLVAFPFICGECSQLLETAAFICESEGWCFDHQPSGSQFWGENELEQFYRLAISQSYREICAEKVSMDFKAKVERFFLAFLRTYILFIEFFKFYKKNKIFFL